MTDLKLPELPEGAATGKCSTDDGSLFGQIAPTGWITYEQMVADMRRDAWVDKGRAELCPLYTAAQLTAYATAAVLAERAAAEADARRYRWLRDHWTVSQLSGSVAMRNAFGIVADNKAGVSAVIDDAIAASERK